MPSACHWTESALWIKWPTPLSGHMWLFSFRWWSAVQFAMVQLMFFGFSLQVVPRNWYYVILIWYYRDRGSKEPEPKLYVELEMLQSIDWLKGIINVDGYRYSSVHTSTHFLVLGSCWKLLESLSHKLQHKSQVSNLYAQIADCVSNKWLSTNMLIKCKYGCTARSLFLHRQEEKKIQSLDESVC